jgi:hypothetical protein
MQQPFTQFSLSNQAGIHTNALYVLPEGGHFVLPFSCCFLVDGWSYFKCFVPSSPPPLRTACGHVLSLVAAHLETAVSRRLARCRIRPRDLTLGQQSNDLRTTVDDCLVFKMQLKFFFKRTRTQG